MIGVFMLFAYAGYALAGAETMARGESCPLDWSAAGPAQFSGYIGALALDRDKHELGRVVHVAYESSGDTVRFLIISSCLGDMKDKLVAFPVRLPDTKQRMATVIIDTTEQQFRGAPAIESREWTNQAGNIWANQAYHYFENTFEP